MTADEAKPCKTCANLLAALPLHRLEKKGEHYSVRPYAAWWLEFQEAMKKVKIE